MTKYEVKRDGFELRNKHGKEWTSDEIFGEYLSQDGNDPVLLGSFDNLDEARVFFNEAKKNCWTAVETTFYGFLIIRGDLVFIEENEYDEDEDGEMELTFCGDIWDSYAEPVG